MDTTQDSRRPATIDVREALKRTAILLDVIEQSGADLDTLTEPDLDEQRWEELHGRAEQRETWNPHIFAGEAGAFATLREVEDDDIRSEAHKQVMFYWRRAKTSEKIASALWTSYQRAESIAREQDGTIDYRDYKKKLSELLSVVSALADEHAQIVTLAQDAQIGDRARIELRYLEQVTPLLEQFDELAKQLETTGKVHFKRRKELGGQLRTCLTRIDEANRIFSHYSFISFQTRELPES